MVVNSALYHLIDARVGLKMCLVINYGVYIRCIICLMEKEPRPYWIDSDIRGIGCANGYASPSRETMLCSIMIYTVAVYAFRKVPLVVAALGYFLTAVVVFFVGLGEMYTGSHFPHQVFMSYCFTFIYLTICLAFDQSLLNHVHNTAFNYSKNRVGIIYWFLISVLLLLIAITTLDIIVLHKKINIKWLEKASVRRT